jgi:GNAT superfamily N-acetyltransferase
MIASTVSESNATTPIHKTLFLRDGTSVLVRPISGDDAELERRFIEKLSAQTRRFRFLGEVNSPSPQMLASLTHPDATRDAALIALVAEGAVKREIGVARFCGATNGKECECAVVVADEYQGRGLATLLLQELIEIARQRGMVSMYSIDSRSNTGIEELAKHMGFSRSADPDDATQVVYSLDLRAATV